QAHRFKHFFRCLAISWFFEVDHHIGAMKRNHRRPFPTPDQRQEMNRDMPEVDMEQFGSGCRQDTNQHAKLTVGKVPWSHAKLLKPESPREMGPWLVDNSDPVEGK